jgi:hypothetical protein
MIVNIDLYIREKLFNDDDDIQNNTINGHTEKIMNTIYNYMHDNKITRDGILTTIDEGLINFKNQNGGAGGIITEVKLKDDKKYYYNIERIVSKNSNKYNICFINIRENNNNCLCFKYSSKESILTLTELSANDDCVVCQDKSHKYKVGDILMQIFLQYVKDNKDVKHITEIQLQDTSMKKCYGIGIRLKYLRTITHGEPYYAKYGFRPYEKKACEIYRYNRKLHKENVMLDNKVVDKIFENTKDRNNKKPYLHYVKKYKKYILKTNPIDIKLLINKIIIKGDCEDIDIETRKNGCELLSYAIVPLYNALGYKDYVDDDGTLFGNKLTLKIR